MKTGGARTPGWPGPHLQNLMPKQKIQLHISLALLVALHRKAVPCRWPSNRNGLASLLWVMGNVAWKRARCRNLSQASQKRGRGGGGSWGCWEGKGLAMFFGLPCLFLDRHGAHSRAWNSWLCPSSIQGHLLAAQHGLNSICILKGRGHSEILWYLSLHFSSTLAVLPNLIVRGVCRGTWQLHAAQGLLYPDLSRHVSKKHCQECKNNCQYEGAPLTRQSSDGCTGRQWEMGV